MKTKERIENGWAVGFFTDPKGRPGVLMQKGEHWVKTLGREGIDPEVLVDRARISACEKDVELADAESRGAAKRALAQAHALEQANQLLRQRPGFGQLDEFDAKDSEE